MKPMTIILIGAIIVIVGGFVGAIGTWKHNKSSSDKSTRIEQGVNKGVSLGENTNSEVIQLRQQNENLITQSQTLTQKIDSQSKTIDDLRKENSELYSKLAEKSLAIYENLTGGDSNCYMQIGNFNSTNDLGNLIFLLNGKNPLNRIQVRIVNLNTFDKETPTLENINKNTIDLGTLDPDNALFTHYTIKLDKTIGINLNVFFTAANGFTVQKIKMRFVQNKWLTATNISDIYGIKQIYRKVDSEFPIPEKEGLFK
jgi:hypothetical protein